VETTSGKCFEGVFATWSPDFELVLEQVHEIKGEGKATSNYNNITSMMACAEAEVVQEKIIFPRDQVVSMTIQDLDLEYATKGKTTCFAPPL